MIQLFGEIEEKKKKIKSELQSVNTLCCIHIDKHFQEGLFNFGVTELSI